MSTTGRAYVGRGFTHHAAGGAAPPADDLYVAQVVLEVAYNVSPVLYVSQAAVETMIQPSVQTVRVAQGVVEVMIDV